MNSLLEIFNDPAATALILLTAIPPVGILLFADYEERHLKRLLLMQKLQQPQIAILELQKIRLLALMAQVFQVVLIFGSPLTRTRFPVVLNGASLLAVLIQAVTQIRLELWIHARAQKNAQTSVDLGMGKPSELLSRVARGGGAIALGCILYFASVLLALRVGLGIPRLLGVTDGSPWVMAAAFVGGWSGILLGLVVNFSMAQAYLRWIFSPRAVREGVVAQSALDVFGRAGLAQPRVFVFEKMGGAPFTALVTTVPFFQKRFRPAVFISQRLATQLTPEELHAVICHEAAHLQRRHLNRRLGYALAWIFGATAVSSALLVISVLVQRASGMAPSALLPGVLLGVLAFVLTFRALGMQSQKQEREADEVALANLGADPEALAQAIVKVNLLQRGEEAGRRPSPALFATHPVISERLAWIRAWEEKQRGMGSTDSTSQAA